MILNCIYLFLALNLVKLYLSFQLFLISVIIGTVLTALLLILLKQTSYLLIGTVQRRSEVTHSSVYFPNLVLTPTDSARNLGVAFDSNLDFKTIFLLFADLLSSKSNGYVRSVPYSTNILPLS